MRKLILEQLKKCKVANMPNIDINTTEINIPKFIKPEYKEGSSYLIKIPGELINNDNSILATNWNNGTSPKYPYLKIYVTKTFGKMIYVDTLAYDIENNKDIFSMWTGWLEASTLKLISNL